MYTIPILNGDGVLLGFAEKVDANWNDPRGAQLYSYNAATGNFAQSNITAPSALAVPTSVIIRTASHMRHADKPTPPVYEVLGSDEAIAALFQGNDFVAIRPLREAASCEL